MQEQGIHRRATRVAALLRSLASVRAVLNYAALAMAMAPVPTQAAIAFRAASQGSSADPATITFVARVTTTGNAASVTINRPAGVAAQDVLIAQVTLKGVVPTIAPPATPNDWNLLDLRSTSTAGAEVTQAVYWRVAGAAEPASYTWSWTGARVVAGGIAAYRGVEATSPIDAWGARSTSNATINLPNITTNSLNTMLVALLGSSRASTHSAPTGMAERYDVNSGTGTAGVTASALTQTQAAAGATGAKTATINAGAADNLSHLIALRAQSSLTIAVPAGTLANDVMLASITFRPCSNTSGGACTVTVTPPAGWTQVDFVDQTTGAGTGGYGNRLFVYRRVASGAEPASYTWSFSGAPVLNGAAGGILSFSGVDTANPIVASADQTTASGSAHAAPNINTGTVTNTMLVSTHSNNSSGTWTRPPGMTEAVDVASLAVPDDLGITLEMNYEIRAAAGATGTRTATLSNPPTADTGATHMLVLRPLAIDHYRVQNNASGVNCQAESVTITAHDSLHSAVTLTSSTTITVTAAFVSGSGGPGSRGDWSIVSGGGTLNNGTADDGVATYTFAAGGESSVVLALKDTWAQTVNVGVADGSATDTSGTASADTGYNQNLTFNAAGFRFVDSGNNSIPNQVAGVTSGILNLQAIQSSACSPTGACTGVCTVAPGFASGTSVSVDLASECVNPIACQAGQLVSIASTSTSTIASNPLGSVTSYTAKPLLFGANGSASFTLSYPDVGSIRLHARYNIPLGTGATSANNVSGASNAFVVKPYSFVVSNVRRTSDNFANPGAANASGAAFIAAGDDFSATVTAVNAASAATPNYGKEITPEGARLIPALVGGLGLTANPAIANNTAFGTFSAGAASGTTFNWGEVGIITLSAGVADLDYLGAGQANVFTQSGNVGRFTPHHFVQSGAAVTNRVAAACSPVSSFTYLSEGIGLQFTLTARNKALGTTQNYVTSGVAANNFAKLPTTPGNLAPAVPTLDYGARASSPATNLSARLNLSTINALTWSAGQAAVNTSIAVNRAASSRWAVHQRPASASPRAMPTG